MPPCSRCELAGRAEDVAGSGSDSAVVGSTSGEAPGSGSGSQVLGSRFQVPGYRTLAYLRGDSARDARRGTHAGDGAHCRRRDARAVRGVRGPGVEGYMSSTTSVLGGGLELGRLGVRYSMLGARASDVDSSSEPRSLGVRTQETQGDSATYTAAHDAMRCGVGSGCDLHM